MRPGQNKQRGFSLTELLTVIGMIGIVTLVTIPALMQVMPQYRIRGAASDAGAGLRMIRQKAVTTRTPWRVSFDAANNRYAYSRLTTPNAVRATAANWVQMGNDGRPLPAGSNWWIPVNPVDLRTATTNSFKDVDCDGYVDIVFLRTGAIARDPNGGGCGAGANLAFATPPSVVFAVDTSLVKYNRYYLRLTENGVLSIVSAKE